MILPSRDGQSLGPDAHWGWRKGVPQKPTCDLYVTERGKDFLTFSACGTSLCWCRTPGTPAAQQGVVPLCYGHKISLLQHKPGGVSCALSLPNPLPQSQSPTQICSLLCLLSGSAHPWKSRICMFKNSSGNEKREEKHHSHCLSSDWSLSTLSILGLWANKLLITRIRENRLYSSEW